MDQAVEKTLSEYKNAVSVRAEVFKPSGKWMYSVCLNYARTPVLLNLPSGWVDPVAAAKLALETATREGTSEVVFERLHPGWFMFVPDPPNGWPIMVTG